jgi:ribosome biogenesis protein BRX1
MGKKGGSKKRQAPTEGMKKLAKKAKRREERDLSKYINKQRTLVFASRGISHRDRHFMKDMADLLPHSKRDAKFDAKDKLFAVNEVCELKSCNNCMFFEARKHKDLYMWLSKSPHGPSAKFLVQNIHTMAETKLTGNCLKGSRPVLSFDKSFDSQPAYALLKELLTQVFGSPKGHPKVKPFSDHVLSFFILDGRIWFRNYQIVFQNIETEIDANGVATKKKTGEPLLVEIGPRFVLNPIKIFNGSFGGATLWENPDFVSPNTVRSLLKRKKGTKFDNRQLAKDSRAVYEEKNAPEPDELDDVFE